MPDQWFRGAQGNIPYGPYHLLLASLQPGHTILRVRFGVQADAFLTPPSAGGETAIKNALSNYLGFGLVTTIGNGSEVPPSPISAANDQAPPTQRWLYRAAAAMRQTALSGSSSTYSYSLDGTWQDLSTKGQVLATGFTSPNLLNLWLSFDTFTGGGWGVAGTDVGWLFSWVSVLVRNP